MEKYMDSTIEEYLKGKGCYQFLHPLLQQLQTSSEYSGILLQCKRIQKQTQV